MCTKKRERFITVNVDQNNLLNENFIKRVVINPSLTFEKSHDLEELIKDERPQSHLNSFDNIQPTCAFGLTLCPHEPSHCKFSDESNDIVDHLLNENENVDQNNLLNENEDQNNLLNENVDQNNLLNENFIKRVANNPTLTFEKSHDLEELIKDERPQSHLNSFDNIQPTCAFGLTICSHEPSQCKFSDESNDIVDHLLNENFIKRVANNPTLTFEKSHDLEELIKDERPI
jgi:hypothetical protein